MVSKENNTKKMSLFDAIGMAMGGMIGGGIFAVLGVAAMQAGNAAFLSFGLAGLLALITGISFSRLTLYYDQYGGSFTFLKEVFNEHIAGIASWFLLLGYTLTISLYAHTFGAFVGRLFSMDYYIWTRMIGASIIIILTAINITGIRQSTVTENILVYSKVALLLLLVGIGFFTLSPKEALPVFEEDFTNILYGAGLIFVAYEGFQLLTYDYDDIKNKQKNLPRAIYISIPSVMIIYMLIAFVTTGTLGDQVIKNHQETVLAYVVEPLLGQLGFTIVVVAAIFSTASAINATIFATSRLAMRVTKEGQLPKYFISSIKNKVPIQFVVMMGIIAIVIQLLGNLHQITTFSSMVFLLIFAFVNGIAILTKQFKTWKIIFPLLAIGGCLVSFGSLVYQLYQSSLISFGIMLVISIVLVFLKWLYKRQII